MSHDHPATTDFDDVWPLVEPVPGWLTPDQARTLWDAVRSARTESVVVEIGSHHGRSTAVLAAAGGRVTAVDPFVRTRRYAGPSVREGFEHTLGRLGLRDRVQLRVATSRKARQGWSGPVDVLYIDGKHDYWTVRDDLRWAQHVVPGGVVLVHDAFSSIGVTSALLVDVLPRRDLAYTGRTGSLATFRRRPPTAADRARMVRELPWWSRNVVVKVLLRLRLARVARLLGHQGADDPF